MAGDMNIQSLFSQLRVEHLLVYLPSNGWRSFQATCEDLVRFELPDDIDPFVIELPRSNASAQCRKLLQHAIYNLSGIEDRQPAEIIRDVLAVNTKGVSETRTQPSVRLRLCNRRSAHPISLQLASRETENVLLPGEAIEVLVSPAEEGLIQVDFGDCKVQIDDLFHS